MNNKLLKTLMETLKPITNIIVNTTEHQGESMVALSKSDSVFAIIVNDDLYLRQKTILKPTNKHLFYNKHYYKIVDIPNLKSAEKKDKLLEQATNAYWIASKQI